MEKLKQWWKGRRVKTRKHDAAGHESPDPTPIAVPSGFKRPLTLQEQIRMFVRSESVRMRAEQQGRETFEESQDFDVDDGEDAPMSGFEFSELQEEELRDAHQAVVEEIARRKKEKDQPPAAASSPPAAKPQS